MPDVHPALALWAKSGDPFHPLLAHMLDTAAVATALLEREPIRSRRLFAEDWGLDEENACRVVAWLAGLHDLGKASPVFQRGWAPGAAAVRHAGFCWDEEWLAEPTRWVAHGVFTDVLLRNHLPPSDSHAAWPAVWAKLSVPTTAFPRRSMKRAERTASSRSNAWNGTAPDGMRLDRG